MGTKQIFIRLLAFIIMIGAMPFVVAYAAKFFFGAQIITQGILFAIFVVIGASAFTTVVDVDKNKTIGGEGEIEK